MTDRPFALLVHDHPEPCGELEKLLKFLSVETSCINSRFATGQMTAHSKPPLVFIDMFLTDNSWVNVLDFFMKSDLAPNVIIVGPRLDIELYVSSIERGAYSYVAPPFTPEGLNAIVYSAWADVRDRRESKERATAMSSAHEF